MPTTHLTLSPTHYDDFVRSAFVDESLGLPDGVAAIVLDGRADAIAAPRSLPFVLVAISDDPDHGPDGADLVVAEHDLDRVLTAVRNNPIAATSLAVHLRSIGPDVEVGLAAESALYSVLQAGPEFARWRATAPHEPHFDDQPTVRTDRTGDLLTIALDRPHRHNAISTRLRDELTAALQLAVSDDSLTEVLLAGNGPSFCSGGDLGEFGSRPDPATAHHTRLARSPARLMHRLRHRTTVHLHGAALGGGIELAAFARRVVAHPETRIALPEVSLGLIPGAGGTVSITHRVGRQRTLELALTAAAIDARTALRWGLVDDIVE